MSKNKRKPVRPTQAAVPVSPATNSPAAWILAVCALTAIAFFPMLSNGFTNWDDQFYITDNPMLKEGLWKDVFTRPIMGNYHPLTMASLMLNYQLSSLSPFSYHLVNWLLHILNTALVFYFAYRLAGGNKAAGLITALLFGVHPMHVESVAWASERKDVLYTAFFLLSLLVYLRYAKRPDWKTYVGALVLFLLSLLSKPAAVTLPLVLLLTDWYLGRSMKDSKVWLEKLPFFALSLVFGLLTLKYQASAKAIDIAGDYPFWQKMAFSVYGFGEYIKRLFWPFPMAAIHPFPDAGVIPGHYYFSMLIGLVLLVAAWFYRKKRYVVYGIGFYAVNVAIVLQLLSFGHAVIAERYTYMPYIGLAFSMAMLWSESGWTEQTKKAVLGIFLVAGLAFAAVSWTQVKVWENGLTLWTNTLNTYPDVYIARANRAQYLAFKQNKFDEALEDYRVALQEMPNDSFSLINRGTIYINQKNYPAALADGDSLVKTVPWKAKGYLIRGVANDQLGNKEQALDDYSKCIQRDSFESEAWSGRGVLNYNLKRDYQSAKLDFDKAIILDPKKGVNYKNRARCWIKFGKKAEALKDLETANQLGVPVGDDLMQAAQALK